MCVLWICLAVTFFFCVWGGFSLKDPKIIFVVGSFGVFCFCWVVVCLFLCFVYVLCFLVLVCFVLCCCWFVFVFVCLRVYWFIIGVVHIFLFVFHLLI